MVVLINYFFILDEKLAYILVLSRYSLDKIFKNLKYPIIDCLWYNYQFLLFQTFSNHYFLIEF